MSNEDLQRQPSLEAPLIDEGAAKRSEDPFYGFLDELWSRIQATQAKTQKWSRVLESANTAQHPTFREDHKSLKQEVSQLLTNVQELEEVVYRIETNRANFPHISDEEVLSRKNSVVDMKKHVNAMKITLTSQKTVNKMRQDEQAALKAKNGPAEMEMSVRNQSAKINSNFVAHQQQQQELIIQEQDGHLDDLHQSASRLNVLAENIHDEIEDQNRMLDDLSSDLDETQGRMEHALQRMDKLLKSNNRCQTWTILSLILIAFVMFLLIANF
mmetsp:Transcript_1832/g.2134  ORF Transcript_1832/g.2134 Transcript_1832/m.2134 type:complete len:271 (+) Transcript_1832:161-973(+)